MAMTRKEAAMRSALIFMGVFTMTPVLAIFNPAQLGSYGVIDPNQIVLTLLQHRGLLQCALGASLIFAALRPDVRGAVAVAAIFTKGGGLLLILARPDVLAEASTVVMVFDPICIVLLATIMVDRALQSRLSSGNRQIKA